MRWTDCPALVGQAPRRFTGTDGMVALRGAYRFAAPVPERFDCLVQRVRFDDIVLERFEATSFTAERSAVELEAAPAPMLSAVTLLRGRLLVRLADCEFDAEAGQHLLIDGRTPVRVEAAGDVSLIRCSVGVQHLPSVRHRRSATVPGAVGRSALADSFLAFVDSLLRTAKDGDDLRSASAINAIAVLLSALLMEAQQRVEHPDGPIGLRYRIDEHIENHYTEPNLDVSSIARALSISVRHAHAVFDDGDRTIARVIRDRRAASAADELDETRVPGRLADLAGRHGFSNSDHLTRAFQDRYGTTPISYLDRGTA